MLMLLLLAQIQTTTRNVPVPVVRDHPVRLVAQVHRLWDPATGNQVAVVPFTLVVDAFFGVRDSAAFVVELRAGARPTRSEPDSLTQRLIVLRGRSPQASGVFSVAIPREAGDWRVVAQESGRKSETWVDIPLSRLDEPPFGMSDLVVGASGQGVAWGLGSEKIVLAPNQTVSAVRSVHVYYQLRTESAVAQVRTRITVSRIIEHATQPDQVLSLAFPTERVTAGVTHVQREIDVSNLGGSRYQMEIEIFAANGERIGTTRGMLELTR